MKLRAMFDNASKVDIQLLAESEAEEKILALCEGKEAKLEVIHAGHPSNRKVQLITLSLEDPPTIP